jgi:hypothetical protein
MNEHQQYRDIASTSTLVINDETPRQGQHQDHPIPWNDLQRIIQCDALHLLGRSDPQQLVYQTFNASLKEEWDSAASFLLHSKFGLPVDRSTLTHSPSIISKKRVSIPQTFQTLKLLPNDFPYNFEGGVRHYCLWKIDGLNREVVTPDEIQVAIEELRDIVVSENGCDKESVDTCFYTNPVALKSILDIDHVHILARVKRV